MSEPKRTGLLQLLGNSLGCQFVIPVYQRNYTWAAEREVKQYFDDLQSVLKGDYKNHFMLKRLLILVLENFLLLMVSKD